MHWKCLIPNSYELIMTNDNPYSNGGEQKQNKSGNRYTLYGDNNPIDFLIFLSTNYN